MRKFGNQIYLSHPVHLTLFTLDIKRLNDLKKTYSQYKLKKQKKNLKLTLSKTGIFYNDPLTNGHTLYFSVNKNKELLNLQTKNLKLINKKIDVIKKNIKIFNNSMLKKNYKRYGFPFAGNIWIPHITIASIKNINPKDNFLINFLKIKVKFSDIINEIKFYKVKNNKHFFLFKTDIF